MAREYVTSHCLRSSQRTRAHGHVGSSLGEFRSVGVEVEPEFLERREAKRKKRAGYFFFARDQGSKQSLLAFVVLTQQVLKLAGPSGRIRI